MATNSSGQQLNKSTHFCVLASSVAASLHHQYISLSSTSAEIKSANFNQASSAHCCPTKCWLYCIYPTSECAQNHNKYLRIKFHKKHELRDEFVCYFPAESYTCYTVHTNLQPEACDGIYVTQLMCETLHYSLQMARLSNFNILNFRMGFYLQMLM